jgi:hypothetical protein
MPVKVELIMKAFGQSWSEAHYFLPSSNLQDGAFFGSSLAAWRANALGQGASVTAVRVSNVPGNRSTQSFNNNGYGWSPVVLADPTGSIWQATLPNVSLLIRLYHAMGLSNAVPPKNLYLACPPAVAVKGGANQNLDDNLVANGGAIFLQNLRDYLRQLTGGNPPSTPVIQNTWGYRARDDINSQDAVDVVAQAGAPGLVGIQTVDAVATIFAGDEVYVRGFRRENDESPGLNGTWRVAVFIPAAPPTIPFNTYYLAKSGNVSPTNFTRFGQIMPNDFLYVAYDPQYDVVKAVTRKRGGSIGLRRGRLKTR